MQHESHHKISSLKQYYFTVSVDQESKKGLAESSHHTATQVLLRTGVSSETQLGIDSCSDSFKLFIEFISL